MIKFYNAHPLKKFTTLTLASDKKNYNAREIFLINVVAILSISHFILFGTFLDEGENLRKFFH